MAEELLKVENLRVEYKTDDALIYALNGVDLTVRKGETLGLVGETGAGKTTLAMSVLRLLPKGIGMLKEGSITFDGVDLLAEKEHRMLLYRGKRIAMIFQDPMTSLNPLIPVGMQVAEILKLHNDKGMTDAQIDERVDELFTMVGLPKERKGEYPHQFSGGMKQRVVIAISLACEPELLIADEPTTALDVTIQAQVLKLMRDLKERMGTSMILITHDLGIVAENCDSVAVMYAGEIVESGTIYDIFEGEEHHPYTEGLFGSIPNLDEDTDRLRPIEGMPLDPSLIVQGCRFASRCRYATEKCKSEAPEAVWRGSHMLCCHRMAEEA